MRPAVQEPKSGSGKNPEWEWQFTGSEDSKTVKLASLAKDNEKSLKTPNVKMVKKTKVENSDDEW